MDASLHICAGFYWALTNQHFTCIIHFLCWQGPHIADRQAHLVLLHFTDVAFLFYKLKFCGNPASSKPTSATFPIAFAHLMFLCHILGILSIVQPFSLLYLFWWSVISNLCFYRNSLKAQVMVSIFRNKVFFDWGIYIVFLNNAIAHSIDCNIIETKLV